VTLWRLIGKTPIGMGIRMGWMGIMAVGTLGEVTLAAEISVVTSNCRFVCMISSGFCFSVSFCGLLGTFVLHSYGWV